MRAEATNGDFALRAISGSHVVLLALDATAEARQGLLGFAIKRTDVIEDQTRSALDGLVKDFRINWVWMPPWGPEKITDDGREQLRALGFNV